MNRYYIAIVGFAFGLFSSITLCNNVYIRAFIIAWLVAAVICFCAYISDNANKSEQKFFEKVYKKFK